MISKYINLEVLEVDFIMPNRGEAAADESERFAVYDFPTAMAAARATRGIRDRLGNALHQIQVQSPVNIPTRLVIRKPQDLRNEQARRNK